MRILLISQAGPRFDRPRADARGPARLLADAGHEVTVLSARHLPLAAWRGLDATVEEDAGVRVVRVNLLAGPRMLSGLEGRGAALLTIRALAFLGIEIPDVVHALSVTAESILAKELSLRWQRPYAITAHGHGTWHAMQPGQRSRNIVQSVKDAAGIAATHREIADQIADEYARTDVEVLDHGAPDGSVERLTAFYERAVEVGERPRVIFHAPYPIDPRPSAASRLRPLKMLQSFRELGFQVNEITGNPRDRAVGFRDVRRRRRAGQDIDLLYSENSTQPNILATSVRTGLAPFLEARIFWWARRAGVPAGEFYRDIYWRFLASNREIRSLRSLVRHLAYRGDLVALRTFGVHLFLPSTAMGPELPFPEGRYSALPPGGDVRESPIPEGVHLFYVGGLGENHGLDACLEAVEATEGVTLTMSVPQHDWERDGSAYAPYLSERIRVVHAGSDELEPYYDAASACVLFVEPSPYRRFAMPVKLFDYLGNGKPILLSEGTLAGEVGAEMGVGVEIRYTHEDFARTLRELVADPSRLEAMASRAREVRHDHTWTARATTAVSVLRPDLAPDVTSAFRGTRRAPR